MLVTFRLRQRAQPGGRRLPGIYSFKILAICHILNDQLDRSGSLLRKPQGSIKKTLAHCWRMQELCEDLGSGSGSSCPRKWASPRKWARNPGKWVVDWIYN